MSSNPFQVWGFDGELKGNEDRLQARLPMFRAEGESEVFLARTLDWSPALRDTEVVRIPAARAAEYGERLESEVAVRIEPGQYVVVFGPRMRERLLARNIPVIAHPAQDGFGFSVLPPTTFNAYAALIEKRARREFDAAVASGGVTDSAYDALAIMRNSGTGQLRDHLLRTLVLHKLTGDADQFRRVLRLASRRLRDEPERLKKAVDEHLEFVRSSVPAARPVVKTYVPGVSPVKVITVNRTKKTGYYGTVNHPLVSSKSLFPSLPSVTIDDSQDLTDWIVRDDT